MKYKGLKYKVDYVGFVYLWRDKKTNRYYVGSARRSLKSSYKCSNTHCKSAIAKRPDDFKRKVIFLQKEGTNAELKKEEQRWLNMIRDDELGDKYYNLIKFAGGGRPFGSKNSETSNLKRSLAMKGRPKPKGFGQGRKHTEETKQKISAAKKGKPNGLLGKKINRIAPPWNKAVPMSDEQKEKLRQANLGKTLTLEHRKAIGDGNKGKRRGSYKIKIGHCGSSLASSFIKDLRCSGLTWDELEKLLNTSKRTIYRWFKDEKKMTPDQLNLIQKIHEEKVNV